MAGRKCYFCKQEFQPRTQDQGFCSTDCNKAARQGHYRTQRKAALARDGYQCQECAATTGLECHHIQPLSKGGTHDLDNLQTRCTPCHRIVHQQLRVHAPPHPAATGSRPWRLYPELIRRLFALQRRHVWAGIQQMI